MLENWGVNSYWPNFPLGFAVIAAETFMEMLTKSVRNLFNEPHISRRSAAGEG
jgi:hypothetical protein